MDFRLSDEEDAIRDMARSFAESEFEPHAMDWDQNKIFPAEALRKAASLGMGGLTVSEASGGSGLSRLAVTLVIEELARGCVSTAAYLSIHNMVAGMIDRYGDADQKQRFLPRLLTMESFASYCLTEPGAGSDAAALTTRAERDGDHYVLTGQKQFISGAGESDVYLVMARSGGPGPKGISAFLVTRDMAGLSFGANERKMGWNTQPTRAVMLDSVRVPAENRLGSEGQGFAIAMAGLDGGRLSIAAASLGGAQAAFEKSARYLAGRSAFGQKLADFQALQFRLADMETDLEVARTFLWRTATAMDNSDPDLTRLSAMAKRHVTDRAFAVANDALQLFGGYGYLADYGIEKILRDLRVHQILEGTNEIMRVIIARSIRSRFQEDV